MIRRLVALALVLAACGDGGVPLDEYNARRTEALCALDVRCGSFPSIEQCVTDIDRRPTTVPQWASPSLIAAVEAGAVTYDGVEAAECLDDLAATECDLSLQRFRVDPVVCVGVFRGSRPDGLDCGMDAECVSRNCEFDGSCVPEACCAGVCAPPREQRAGPGESCVDYPCAPVAYCDGAICRPLLPEGAPCGITNQCDFGLSCGGTCEPRRKLGEPCYDGSWSGCIGGTTCDRTSNRCVPLLTEGSSCDPAADQCADYLYCASATATCVPLPVAGESCLGIGRCGPGAWCAFLPPADAVCAALAPNGSQCSDGYYCASGTCSSTGVCIDAPVCF